MRQSKVRAEDVQQVRDLVRDILTQIGCDILDVRKFVFYPKKSRQFLRLNLHSSLISFVYCFYSMNVIIGVIVKLLLQQRLLLSSHFAEWPFGQVGRKQLFSLLGVDRNNSE